MEEYKKFEFYTTNEENPIKGKNSYDEEPIIEKKRKGN